MVFNAVKGGLAGSTVLNAKAPMVIARNFKPGFRIRLHQKDLRNALLVAALTLCVLPRIHAQQTTAAQAAQQDSGESEHDQMRHSSMVKTLGRRSVPIPKQLSTGRGMRLVQAFVEGEPATAVPVDQIVLSDHEPASVLMLPRGRFWLRTIDPDQHCPPRFRRLQAGVAVVRGHLDLKQAMVSAVF